MLLRIWSPGLGATRPDGKPRTHRLMTCCRAQMQPAAPCPAAHFRPQDRWVWHQALVNHPWGLEADSVSKPGLWASVRASAGFPGMGPGMGPPLGPGMGPGMHPGTGPGMGPGIGPGMHPAMQPAMGPGMGPVPGMLLGSKS